MGEIGRRINAEGGLCGPHHTHGLAVLERAGAHVGWNCETRRRSGSPPGSERVRPVSDRGHTRVRPVFDPTSQGCQTVNWESCFARTNAAAGLSVKVSEVRQ